jgi:hypothetical protein
MPLDLSNIILNINTLNLSDVSINDLSCNNLNILNSLQSTENVYTNNDISFNGGNLIINNKLGINNTNPLRSLEVNGDISFSGILYNGNNIYSSRDGFKDIDPNDDISCNNLYITNDLTTNNLFCNNDLSLNNNLTLNGNILNQGNKGIIQVVSVAYNGNKSINASGSNVNDFSGLSELNLVIYPQYSNSKILLMLNLYWSDSSSTNKSYLQGLVRKSVGRREASTIVTSTNVDNDIYPLTFCDFSPSNNSQYSLWNVDWHYLDSANTTTMLTYYVSVRLVISSTNAGSGYQNQTITTSNLFINRTSSTNDANRLTGVSTFTAIEILI